MHRISGSVTFQGGAASFWRVFNEGLFGNFCFVLTAFDEGCLDSVEFRQGFLEFVSDDFVVHDVQPFEDRLIQFAPGFVSGAFIQLAWVL
ncbi:MAG: hypothetical protein WCI74_01735 [Actinomycetes bacterium]